MARTTPARILDTTLDIADDMGWGRLRLRQVAARLNLSMADIRKHYRDKDAIADAWFARADAAMLAKRGKGFARLPATDRLYRVITAWLDALAPYRGVTGEMLGEKLYPGHPHHNLALVWTLSRTVQWIRDAAHLDATGRRKQVEEIGLTALFAATVFLWLRDDSVGQQRTRTFLADRLADADAAMARLWPPR